MNKAVLNEKHIFIFAVCGRSSSTALQRILNSSNEICIWGEQFNLIDDLMKIIHELDHFLDDENVYWHVRILINSFRNEYHLKPYPTAIGNLFDFRSSLIDALIKNLTVSDLGINRFGFKCIRLKKLMTLQVLSKIFPNSQFIFLFRNPVHQWPSVNYLNWWDYAYNLQDFLKEYQRISSIMLEYLNQNNRCILLENSEIKNENTLKKVLARIKINSVDQEVVDKTIFSAGNISPTCLKHKKIIKNHKAYTNYLTLKKRRSNNLRM